MGLKWPKDILFLNQGQKFYSARFSLISPKTTGFSVRPTTPGRQNLAGPIYPFTFEQMVNQTI